ncbi:hypothetical protein ATCC90586_007079 [Pythium insidiosum]|nr:hypothetical protein ATCC90586_007079 [Pythium insidiosum]
MPPPRGSRGGQSRGVIGTLRRVLLRRRDPPRVVVRPEPSDAAPVAPILRLAEPQALPNSPTPVASIDPLPNGTTAIGKQEEAGQPLPPREPSDDEDDYEDVDNETDDEPATEELTKQVKQKRKKKKKERTQWVAKLLNQVGVTKDRVHRRKRKRPQPTSGDDAASRRCHALHLAPAQALHLRLLGRIFAFLQPTEPARTCATVNTTWSVGVREFYDRAVGAEMESSIAMDLLLSMLDEDFNTQIRNDDADESRQHQDAYDSERDSLSSVESDGDEPLAPPVALTTLELSRVRGFQVDNNPTFIQLVQLLFTDNVSRRLERLELSDLGLEDDHFRHLSRLLYDGRFPALRALSLSHNAFSSRFMRDWAKGFLSLRCACWQQYYREDTFALFESFTAVRMPAVFTFCC